MGLDNPGGIHICWYNHSSRLTATQEEDGAWMLEYTRLLAPVWDHQFCSMVLSELWMMLTKMAMRIPTLLNPIPFNHKGNWQRKDVLLHLTYSARRMAHSEFFCHLIQHKRPQMESTLHTVPAFIFQEPFCAVHTKCPGNLKGK